MEFVKAETIVFTGKANSTADSLVGCVIDVRWLLHCNIQ